MEEDAAEVEESQMDITLTFEEWKANERVTWEESKTQSSISEGFFFLPPPVISVMAFMCSVLMTGGW